MAHLYSLDAYALNKLDTSKYNSAANSAKMLSDEQMKSKAYYPDSKLVNALTVSGT